MLYENKTLLNLIGKVVHLAGSQGLVVKNKEGIQRVRVSIAEWSETTGYVLWNTRIIKIVLQTPPNSVWTSFGSFEFDVGFLPRSNERKSLFVFIFTLLSSYQPLPSQCWPWLLGKSNYTPKISVCTTISHS